VLQQMRSAAKWVWLFVAVAFVGGFLVVETSGLLGTAPLTPTTPVAEVNGREILYSQWQARVQQAMQNQQQAGRALTQDEVRQIENETLDEMIMAVLLEQEYRSRGIGVTDEELREFARYAPPPFLYNSADLQTEGRFDPAKYQRLLASPQARQQGLLVALENYYRTEIPKEKLFEQITDGIYVTDAELWRSYQDENDTTQVSFLAWRPAVDSAAIAAVSDDEARRYFDAHEKEYERPGHAWLSVVRIPRAISAADSAAVRARLVALRDEIAGGARFEDVARRESADTVSGAEGGSLGRGGRNRFVPEFESAAYALRAGQLSGPVLTPFGYHLIKVDERKGDTLALRHILLRIQQSDSAATATDRQADELARIAAGVEDRAKFDTAARELGLEIHRAEAVEGQVATVDGMMVPSASAWAFGGARAGETSDLFDDDNGYWLVRLDSISLGGDARFDRVRQEVKQQVALDKALDVLAATASRVAAAAATSGLEAAAQGAGQTIVKSQPFTRVSMVPGIGQFSQAVGAAFALPVGAVSAPIRTDDGIFIIRVDRRTNASRAEFEKARAAMRQSRVQQLKQQRLQMFLSDLRRAAKIEDHRRDIMASQRRLES
jgi:peptidyl-prolyl cis-trans isomerase D